MSNPWNLHQNHARHFHLYPPSFRVPPPNFTKPPPYHFGEHNQTPQRYPGTQFSNVPPGSTSHTGLPPFHDGPLHGQKEHLPPNQISNEDFMKEWLGKVKEEIKEKHRSNKNVRISDVQKQLLQYVAHIKTLEEYVGSLEASETEAELQKLLPFITQLETQIQEISSDLNNPDYISSVKISLERRRMQRKRASKNKERQRSEKKAEAERIKEKHAIIDKWQQSLLEAEQAKVQEEKLRKEADNVLGEVKGKQEDIRKMRKLLENLVNLRKVRSENAETKGIVATPEAEKVFQSLIDKLNKVINEQADEYRLEEATLRSMMEESPSQSFQPRYKPKNMETLKKEIKEVYMGTDNTEDPHWNQAEASFEKLVEIRRDWDKYISDDVIASSIPVEWVLPNKDATDEWKAFLTK